MAKETAKPTYDAGEEGQVKARRRWFETLRKRELDDISEVASTVQGRRLLRRIWEECRVFHVTHVPGDSHQTAFNEGNRNLGLRFLNDVFEACPDRFREAMAEKKKEDETDG